jgi:amino acid transporter
LESNKDSLSLGGAVAMGTGVMIGAGIFALTGQVAELGGTWFPLAFLVAGVIAGFSSYSYIKVCNKYPSSGGIAMILKKAYGPSTITGASSLLMYFSMVMSESLVARTFGSYTAQVVDFGLDKSFLVPLLGVILLLFAFLVNLMSNSAIQKFSYVMAFVKIGGLSLLALGGLWASGLEFQSVSITPEQTNGLSFLGAVAIAILAFKGFTTITNSGGELENAEKNVSRAIVISLSICLFVYLLTCFAVAGNLSIEEIVKAKNYLLAEASRPAFGEYGVWITVLFAIAATVSGVIASAFAVSRMLAMLTDMDLVPHSHFGMPGDIQKHTLVYTIVLAMILTVLFDLSSIASLGAIFYIVMDIVIHWGVLRHLRKDVGASTLILITAIILDLVVLGALLWVKSQSDMTVIWAAAIGFVLIFAGEKFFLKFKNNQKKN